MTGRGGPFVVALSPYHLTTREPAAMAMLLLAEHAVTLMPAPFGGRVGASVSRAAVDDAARATPVYLSFMESWQWAMPLFREGVVGSVFAGEDAADDARAACGRVVTDAGLSPLRRFMRPELFEDDRAYLSAVARDVLRAGPDPAVSVPLLAGLDSFAARHGLAVARSHAVSVAQRAEQRMGRRLAAFVVPVLTQASGERVLLGRALLEEPLSALREAAARALRPIAAGDGGVDESALPGLKSAAAAYAAAFEAHRADLTAPPGRYDADEVRVVAEEVSVSLLALPVDAVLRSSLAAAWAVDGPGRGGGRVAARGEATPAWREGECVAAVVKRLGAR